MRPGGGRCARRRHSVLRAARAIPATAAPRRPRRRPPRARGGTSRRAAASDARTRRGTDGVSASVLLDPQHREERLLRDLDRADHLHALLAGVLLLQRLLLARDA